MVLNNPLHNTIHSEKYIIYGHQATTNIAVDDDRHPILYNFCSVDVNLVQCFYVNNVHR